MSLFQKYSIDRLDVVKFILLMTIFAFSFSAYNSAYSPVVETTYNSASIFSHEQKSIELFGWNGDDESVQVPAEVKEIENLVISFRPENITIDDSLLEKIKTNAESKIFSSKISPLHLLVDTIRKEPRGQVSGNTLILSGKISGESESLKVFVHELGHIVDIYYLPTHEDGADLSNDFYSISWLDYNVKKKDAIIWDFVSGYALSNKYEDFAESFAFYVFHNDEFARRAKSNPSLQDKYDFLKNNVFLNNEFFSTNFASEKLRSYNWDVTKIPVNVKKYLYYIQ
jgi:hypothetical protein